MNLLSRILSRITTPIRSLLSSPLKILSTPGRLFGFSLPTRIAIFVGLMLFIALGVFVWWNYARRDLADNLWTKWYYWLILLVLVVGVPLAVRRVVALFLEGPPSPYPDIDEAFWGGVAALEEQGLDMMGTPIFLVAGLPGENQIGDLFAATHLSFVVRGVPKGREPLRWYATSDAVYLVCEEMSQLAKLVDMGSKSEGVATTPKPMASIRETLSRTLQAMDLDDIREPKKRPDLLEPVTAPPPGNISMTLDAGMSLAPDSSAPSRPAKQLSQADAADTAHRLAYVCRLLHRVRQPACPVNGILTSIPYSLLLDEAVELSQIQRAILGDLETLHRGLRMRCPAFLLVTGMENEIGFRELTRRVGPENAKRIRVGRRCDVRAVPTSELVGNVAANVRATFERYAYDQFGKPGGLDEPGNSMLYSLVCKVRTEIYDRLAKILVHTYGSDASTRDGSREEPFFFGGCYFAATGQREDVQAFARGVVHSRLMEEQDYLEWNREARAEEMFFQVLAHIGLLVDAVLMIVLVCLFFYWLSR